jgi:UDP-2,3-diacylglucosamine hydrolase
MDQPERCARFARWVGQMASDDSLILAGDLCDFWMGSRLGESKLLGCGGLRALAEFRSRGGTLSIMAGNHDRWLCPFYERVLGSTILADPFETTIQGIRLHLVHGHLLGGRKRWKAWMESREFWRAFGQLPFPLASALDQILERKNAIGLAADERRHLAVFRTYTASLQGLVDLVVFGHVHRPVDDQTSNPRMIVLGGWQNQASYLKIDDSGAAFHMAVDFASEMRQAEAPTFETTPSKSSFPAS